MLARVLTSGKQIWLASTIALAGLSQAQVAMRIVGQDGAPSLWLIHQNVGKLLPCPESSRPLSWSTDGRWLILGEPKQGGRWSLSLFDNTSPVPATFPVIGTCSTPSWSPDGRRFVYESIGQGLRIADVSGSDPLVRQMQSAGHVPAWSPNGGRIAYGGRKPDPGIWVTNEAGSKSHRIEATLEPQLLCWAPDGQALLAVSEDKKAGHLSLSVVSASGKTARRLGDTDIAYAAWSPNGERILARKNKVWGCYETKDGRWTALDMESAPVWQGSKAVAGVVNGQAVRAIVGQKGSVPFFGDPPSGIPSGKTLEVVPCQGLVLDGKVASPFGALDKPKPGQIRITGIVEDIDLSADTVTVAIATVLSADGMELNLAQPIHQPVLLTSLSRRPSSKGELPLRGTDFVQLGEVSLTVMGMKAGVPEALPVINGSIPELAVEGGSTEMAVTRVFRSLDYDGVSMDSVVVPLLFPVAGKVDWSDTFLASRGGGSRRHHGQDLMAPKMRPLVACFDGVVKFNRSKAGHNTISLKSDEGWTVVYMHVNNDNPGTDDGKGGDRYAFAAGLKSGDRVVRGQLVGYCGDSGNAEGTGPHCHFELHDDVGGGVLNACPSLTDAEHATVPIVIDPCPTLKPSEGQTRWDLVVVQVDRERNVVVGDLVSCWQGASLCACAFPKRVYIRLSGSTKLFARNHPDDARSVQDLKVGGFVSAIGATPAADQAMDAGSLAIGTSLTD